MERFALLLLPTIIIVTVVSSILIIMKDDQAELEGDVEKLLRKPSPRLSNMVRDEFLTPTIIIMLVRSPSSRKVRKRNGEGTEATVSKSPRPEILAPVSMRYSAPVPSAPPRRRRGRRRRRRSTKRCLRGRTWCS